MNLDDLYNYVLLMKKLGVNYSNHLIFLLKELFQPILIVSFILISAPLILKNNERKFPLTIMCLTILIGFVIYFLVDFMYVLGSMGKLNSYIAGKCSVGVFFYWMLLRLNLRLFIQSNFLNTNHIWNFIFPLIFQSI